MLSVTFWYDINHEIKIFLEIWNENNHIIGMYDHKYQRLCSKIRTTIGLRFNIQNIDTN